MTIRILPEGLINQIAAGEVIERPASAIKELAENSIDAGATRIDVVMRDGGRTFMSVSDDGCGMSKEELSLAVERHATSKLADEDLTHIGTLGFRGEALPSIASVARVRIASRADGSENSWEITVEGGKKGAVQPARQPKGTRVEVRDLFFATPARLKFLKTPRTEFNHAQDVLNRLAMAHPEIGFTLSDGERTPLKVSATHGDLFEQRLSRLSAIMGKEFAENAVGLDVERDGVTLSGYAGLPTLNRANTMMQFLFVNGRPVRDKILYSAIRGGYQDFLAGGRHPYVALFLDVPTEDLDVNVHPAKTEVRFRDAGLVRGLIVSAIKRGLAGAGHKASTTVSGAALGAMRSEGDGPSTLPLTQQNRSAGIAHVDPHEARHTRHSHGFNSGLGERANEFHMPLAARAIDEAPPVSAEELARHPLGVARTQLHETYVVAQNADGIVLVDQHAAHERLTHERLKKQLAADGVKTQGLLIPEVVELDDAGTQRILARAEQLAELGLVVEAFGDNAVVVREIPAMLGETDVKGLITDLADDLADFDDALSLKDQLSDVCATMACHGSIRAGRRLNLDEMNALLREMEVTPHAGQCSHGRPTYVELKLHDIERLFGRR